ncbi:hypothetical protein OK016_11895 [Vibrio chagasii]|nr:hypothetical protein [Vibrio chagasii]
MHKVLRSGEVIMLQTFRWSMERARQLAMDPALRPRYPPTLGHAQGRRRNRVQKRES